MYESFKYADLRKTLVANNGSTRRGAQGRPTITQTNAEVAPVIHDPLLVRILDKPWLTNTAPGHFIEPLFVEKVDGSSKAV